MFVDHDKYAAMLAELDSQRELIALFDSHKAESEQILSQRVAELDAVLQECMRTKVQSDPTSLTTQESLKATEVQLGQTKTALSATQQALEEKTVVASEFHSTGHALHGAANCLLRTSFELKSDVGGLFGKIGRPPLLVRQLDLMGAERQSSLLVQNDRAAAEFLVDVAAALSDGQERLRVQRDSADAALRAQEGRLAEFVAARKEVTD